MSRILKILTVLCTASAVLLPVSVSYAQGESPLQQVIRKPGDKRSMEMMPQFRYQPPKERTFEKIEYLKLDPPLHLQERIERLIHGIKIDIPPEYDHYGHEIRRYMASVGGADVLGSRANIEGQLQNIKNAEIILKYWREAHEKEIALIEEEIQNSNSSSTMRTSFKYHSGVSRAFFVEAGSWMHNNKAVLEYLNEIGPGSSYKFRDNTFKFSDRRELKKFLALFEAQQKALEKIKDYTPFRMMVY